MCHRFVYVMYAPYSQEQRCVSRDRFSVLTRATAPLYIYICFMLYGLLNSVACRFCLCTVTCGNIVVGVKQTA